MASKCGIKLCVKQGEELNRSFTIKQNGNPLSLYDTKVRVQIKNIPTEKAKPLFDKLITTVSDINNEGVIDQPDAGHFILHLNKEDTSHPIGEYYLVISLEDYKYSNIISSNCCGNAMYYICEQ